MDAQKAKKAEGTGMKEYIERAAVEEMLESTQIISDGKYCGYCTEDINLSSIPAADVAPVEHGRWMDAESDDGCIVWHCSVCSYPIKTIGGYPIYKYCPMCGARMDGGSRT